MDGLRWLGLQWDEGPDIGGPYGPYRQSERKEIYQEHARRLIEMDKAYYCFCSPQRLESVRQEQQKQKLSPRYDGTCRRIDLAEASQRVAASEPYVVRFKMPAEGSITVRDHLRGDITFENRSLDDYILIKSDGLALYHLAAMVDDYLMKITHVIRGSEWLPTFPLHGHIVRAFGWPEPVWIHLSVFLKPSGKGKMSKRESSDLLKDGYSIYIKDLRGLGYLPEAVVNWIALMGWSYDDHTEFFSLPDLVEKFSIDHLNPSPAAINFTKFDHFNGLHIRNLAIEELAQRLKPYFEKAGYHPDETMLRQIALLLRERMVTLDDAPEMVDFLFEDQVEPDPEMLVGKNMSAAESAHVIRKAADLLSHLRTISPETADASLRSLADELGHSPSQFFGILRVAITGRLVSPPLLESMAILGKKRTLERLKKAVKVLKE